MADRLHELYRSVWPTKLSKDLSQDFDQAYGNWPIRNDKDYLRRAVIKLIRISDPNMQLCTLPADDTHGKNIRYQDINKDVITSTQLKKTILDLTVPGIMGKTIIYAKNNQKLPNSQEPFSSFIQKFATPSSIYYHDKFAKDLWKVAPRSWKTKLLNDDEEKFEMLELWLKHNKKLNRAPNVKDQWVVPKGHRLYEYFKQGFRILPAPGTVWNQFKGAKQELAILLPLIKKGVMPKGWHTFKYRHPDEAEKIAKKYPKALLGDRDEYWKENLTPVQKAKVDKWKEFLKLVKKYPKMPMLKWWDKLSKNERYLVGNHAKYLDAKFSLHGKTGKLAEWLQPIQDEVNKLRPELKDWYVKKQKVGTLPIRLLQQNAKAQEKLMKLATSGKARPTGALSYSLTGFTRKNSKYPDFNEKIRKIRPDWFDQKILARNRMIAFLEKRA